MLSEVQWYFTTVNQCGLHHLLKLLLKELLPKKLNQKYLWWESVYVFAVAVSVVGGVCPIWLFCHPMFSQLTISRSSTHVPVRGIFVMSWFYRSHCKGWSVGLLLLLNENLKSDGCPDQSFQFVVFMMIYERSGWSCDPSHRAPLWRVSFCLGRWSLQTDVEQSVGHNRSSWRSPDVWWGQSHCNSVDLCSGLLSRKPGYVEQSV